MQTITQNELMWVIQELYRYSKDYRQSAQILSGVERALCDLRAGQLESIASRFETAIALDDKRIAIR